MPFYAVQDGSANDTAIMLTTVPSVAPPQPDRRAGCIATAPLPDRTIRSPTPGASRPEPQSDPPCPRSEEHTSELQSLMRISYAVFCLKKKNLNKSNNTHTAHYTKK